MTAIEAKAIAQTLHGRKLARLSCEQLTDYWRLAQAGFLFTFNGIVCLTKP